LRPVIDSVSGHPAVSPNHDSRDFLHLARPRLAYTAFFCIS